MGITFLKARLHSSKHFSANPSIREDMLFPVFLEAYLSFLIVTFLMVKLILAFLMVKLILAW